MIEFNVFAVGLLKLAQQSLPVNVYEVGDSF